MQCYSLVHTDRITFQKDKRDCLKIAMGTLVILLLPRREGFFAIPVLRRGEMTVKVKDPFYGNS